MEMETAALTAIIPPSLSPYKKERIIITKRQKPVAVIIPYDEYRRSMRLEGYKKIMEVRKVFIKARVKASEVYKESKKQLEDRT